MKSIELLATGLRLVGIYLIVVTVQTGLSNYQALVQFSGAATQANLDGFFLYVVLHVFLLGAASVILIRFPSAIARWLIPETKKDDVVLNGSAKDIQTTLFCVLGIYILSWAVPDLFHNLLWLWFEARQRAGIGEDREFSVVTLSLLVTLIEIAVGLYLTLQAAGLSHLLWRFRTAGSK